MTVPLKPGVMGSAVFVDQGRHRLELHRWSVPVDAWLVSARTSPPPCPEFLWIGMNPSQAEADQDDPTLTKMQGFTSLWEGNSMVVMNYCTLIATNPLDLVKARVRGEMVTVKGNTSRIMELAHTSDRVVVCWGDVPRALVVIVDKLVKELRSAKIPLYCLGTTKHGFPRHPSRQSYNDSSNRTQVRTDKTVSLNEWLGGL